MMLPDGVNRAGACMLIAMREMLDDDDWTDDILVAELRSRQTFNGDGSAALCARHGFVDVNYVDSHGANDVFINVRDAAGRVYSLHRSTPVVVSYKVGLHDAHAVCVPIRAYSGLSRAGEIIFMCFAGRR